MTEDCFKTNLTIFMILLENTFVTPIHQLKPNYKSLFIKLKEKVLEETIKTFKIIYRK